MKNTILTLALFAVSAIAAPAPYPVTINSRAQTAPPLTVYRAAESLFRVSFVDGDTASDITGATAFMSFATNATASVVSTASVSVVAGMTGVVDCVFSPAAVNVAAGRYMYEVGVTPIGGTARIYRQGVFTVVASPYAGSAAAVTWGTNMNWGTINWTGLPNWLLVSETEGWETGSHAGFVTNSADFYPASNPSNYITIADVPAQTNQLYVASAGTVTGSQSNLIDTALQSEADLAALRLYHYGSPDIIESPTNWFLHDGAGTITGINEESVTNWNIVIPWEIGGVPVTGIGNEAFMGSGVTSIVGAGNVVKVGALAFSACTSLASVSLPKVQTVGDYAFGDCSSLDSVSLPQVQTAGYYSFGACISLASVSLPQVQTVVESAFGACTSLASVSLPKVQTVGDYAFGDCSSLASLYFYNDAPTIGDDIFANITPNQVTNYVTNPQATGWGDTLGGMPGGMPVVRLPLHTDSLTLGGVTHTNWPSADVSGLATTQSVAAVAGDLASATIILNNHTSNGTIGSDAHLHTGDRALIDSVPGLATTQDVAAVSDAFADFTNSIPAANYTAWTGTITPANGTATVSIAHGNQPVLVIGAPTVLQLDATGFGTSGVSRVSLSYYTGTNAMTFATNVISYAETPTVDTNGWNTLLIRRVSDGAWKGVGL